MQVNSTDFGDVLTFAVVLFLTSGILGDMAKQLLLNLIHSLHSKYWVGHSFAFRTALFFVA